MNSLSWRLNLLKERLQISHGNNEKDFINADTVGKIQSHASTNDSKDWKMRTSTILIYVISNNVCIDTVDMIRDRCQTRVRISKRLGKRVNEFVCAMFVHVMTVSGGYR